MLSAPDVSHPGIKPGSLESPDPVLSGPLNEIPPYICVVGSIKPLHVVPQGT